MRHLLPCTLAGEVPADRCPLGIACLGPCLGLGIERLTRCNASIQTLLAQHTDLDLHLIEPARMLGRVMQFDAPEYPARLRRWQALVERRSAMGREVVEHDVNGPGFGIVHIDELAHAL